MTSLVVLFSFQIKLNILKQKFFQSSYTVILTDLFNAIKKLWEKISFHKHFKQMKSMQNVSPNSFRTNLVCVGSTGITTRKVKVLLLPATIKCK